MTRYCSDKPVKADKSLEQEVVRQRDVAELKTHALKTKLLNAKHTNKMVRCHDRTFSGSVELMGQMACPAICHSCGPVWSADRISKVPCLEKLGSLVPDVKACQGTIAHVLCHDVLCCIAIVTIHELAVSGDMEFVTCITHCC